MSRVGKKLIPVPAGVNISVGERIEVQGPKGKLTVPIPAGISLEQAAGKIELKRESDALAALHGLTRALLANAVTGVSTGFVRELEITGVGYRADVKGNIINFLLGYSHPIEFVLPAGVDCKIEKQTAITISGIDKEVLGQIAANMRALRPPDPYKNKGVRYKGEILRKKAGKAGAGSKGSK